MFKIKYTQLISYTKIFKKFLFNDNTRTNDMILSFFYNFFNKKTKYFYEDNSNN